MVLSEAARQTAQFLVKALEDKKIERRFSFVVMRDRGRPDHTKPGNGILDSTFRVPIGDLSNLYELDEHGFINVSEEPTSSGNSQWEVRLKDDLFNVVTNEMNATGVTRDISSLTRIFISYSSQDDRIKGELESELQNTYPNVWTDKGLATGERSWCEIFAQIASCDVFVYLISPDSKTSLACRAELSEAMRLNKQVIPLQVRPTSSIPTYIRSEYNITDVSKENVQQISARISVTINKKLSNLESREVTSPLWEKPFQQQVESLRLSVTVLVPANAEPNITTKGQLNTGVLLLPGDTIVISATGKITNDKVNGQGRTWVTADGIDQWERCSHESQAYWKDYCIGSLVGWINGIHEYNLSIAFLVGTSYSKFLTQIDPQGFLYLAINDSIDQYGDNGEKFTVSITVTRN